NTARVGSAGQSWPTGGVPAARPAGVERRVKPGSAWPARGRTPMRRRTIIAVAGLVTLAVLGLSWPQGVDAATEMKWLQWWVNEWGPENHAALIAGFEKENPDIKVTVIDSPYPQMAGKLNAAAASGDQSYDLFGVEASWISGLVKLGYIEKLDPWLV